ncbi:hypothetical protein [Metabacillus hrfriensis]|uniref:Uncharacterized protein n=1 Tax=Metabacillus hrfriensis TaxID=3048891 RepID=A0ACD4R6L6_9BACI|nr:hypothetical protein [Metabacillus sp. CT-WN-B3]WHZ56096.1 hypothetical protein QLQ22_15450 [Metabacillus sp. CT-WN-B3]
MGTANILSDFKKDVMYLLKEESLLEEKLEENWGFLPQILIPM